MTDAELKAYEEKYRGLYWIKDKFEKFKHQLQVIRCSYVIRDDEYTRGYRDALTRVRNTMEEIDRGEL